VKNVVDLFVDEIGGLDWHMLASCNILVIKFDNGASP
jgi:hypothetical protein